VGGVGIIIIFFPGIIIIFFLSFFGVEDPGGNLITGLSGWFVC